MTPTIDEVRVRLDLDHIHEAAEQMAAELTHRRFGAVVLEPDDGTVYPVLIADCEWWDRHHGSGRRSPGGRMIVALVGGSGRAYPWNGDPIHPVYAAEKWTAGHLWTSVVIAEFLTAVSRVLLSDAS